MIRVNTITAVHIMLLLGISSCGLHDPNFRVTPSNVTLLAPKSSAAVGQPFTITAQANLSDFIPAVDHTKVTFSTDFGTLSSTTEGTIGGKASITITAPTAGTARVRASVEGVSAPIYSNTITVNIVVPTRARLVFKTSGTLAENESIGEWGLTVKLPAYVTVKTKPGTQGIDPTVFRTSGLSSSSYIASGTLNPPDGTSTTSYLKLTVSMARADIGDFIDNIIIFGRNIGEAAILDMDIPSGNSVPAKTDFVITDKNMTNISLVSGTVVIGPNITTVGFDYDLLYY